MIASPDLFPARQNSAYRLLRQNLFLMIREFLDKTTKSVTHGAILIAFSSFASKILGLIRDGLFAGNFGTSPQASIYFAAFKLPDFIFNFLVAGGLSVVFLPVFSEYMQKSEEEAWKMANAILNAFLVLVFIFSLFCFAFTPQILRLFIPGFSAQQLAEAVPLTRLLLLSPILMGLSSLLSSILMHFNNFINFSLAPAVYNLCIIGGILFLSPAYGIFGVGIGVIIGAFLHLAIQFPGAAKAGLKFKFLNGFKHPATKRVFLSTIPRTISAASLQLDDLLTTGIVSAVVSVSAISVLSYAYTIQYIPVSFFALPFVIAVFPTLSKQWASGSKREFYSSFSKVLGQIVFFVVPSGVLFYIFRAQIVRLILGTLGKTGVFDLAATKITAACLGIYAFSILATSVIPLFVRGFFAAQDTKTPTVISVFCIALDIALSWLLPTLLKNSRVFSDLMAYLLDLEGFADLAVIGVPLAWFFSSLLQVCLLTWFFYRQAGDFGIKEFFASFGKISFAALLAGAAGYISLCAFDLISTDWVLLRSHLVFSLLTQTVFAGMISLGVYFGLSKALAIAELEYVRRSVFGKDNPF
ncbi:MAG TPA: murein biosynthesis integral membrane protein MurJ [Candidatus Pacearchaeota archaeon]|nr:murein biosynthesis integral membrane protein MurJ [Candidatus Pacearchaeota archaeon]